MSPAIEEAVRRVLDHGRQRQHVVMIPAADYDALAGFYPVERPVAPGPAHRSVYPQRDPDYEREMRQLYANAELDP